MAKKPKNQNIFGEESVLLGYTLNSDSLNINRFGESNRKIRKKWIYITKRCADDYRRALDSTINKKQKRLKGGSLAFHSENTRRLFAELMGDSDE